MFESNDSRSRYGSRADKTPVWLSYCAHYEVLQCETRAELLRENGTRRGKPAQVGINWNSSPPTCINNRSRTVGQRWVRPTWLIKEGVEYDWLSATEIYPKHRQISICCNKEMWQMTFLWNFKHCKHYTTIWEIAAIWLVDSTGI